MDIKEVYLQEERDRIIEFLKDFDLLLDKDINKTFYIEDNNKIIGTISISDYIIKDLAVSFDYQGENLAASLINHAINYFSLNRIYDYQVYTKLEYKNIFMSLGFRKLVETSRLVMLEGGISKIDNVLEKVKNQLENRFAPLDETSDLGSVVINGNPITLGHEYLVEKASKNHLMVVVFIVEEDKSIFTFQERLSMAYLAFHKYSNVCVLPSTKYIVSKLTFPSYFLKEDAIEEEIAKVDAIIFRDYFMKKLFIKKRYIGSETVLKMSTYNQILFDELQDKVVLIERLKEDDKAISARNVRNLLAKGLINEALDFVPKECRFIVSNIARIRF